MDGSSSPDPLNDSPAYEFNLKPRRTPRASLMKSATPQHISPKKQTFQLELGSELSPQRIRVTVEADDSDNDNQHYSERVPSSPSRAPNFRRERTFTTTVPVKGLSDTEANTSIQYAATPIPKKPRGRPRKAGTPVPTKKRANTPTSRSAAKRKTLGEVIDGDDEEDVDFRLSQAAEVDKGKGRARSPSKGPRKSKPRSDENAPKKRGRPRKSLPIQDETLVEMQLDGYDGDFTQAQETGSANGEIPSAASSAVGLNTTTDREDHIPDAVLARFHPGDETPRQPGWSSPRLTHADAPSGSRHRAHSYPSPTESPARTDSDIEYEDDNDDHDQEQTQFMDEEDETVGEPRDFDTIMESEEFSMISVDSVTSLREHLKTSAEQLQKTAIMNSHLLAVQRQAVQDNDSFSSIPADVLEAASPVRKPFNTAVLPTQRAVDESFFGVSVSLDTSKTPAKLQNRLSEANQEYATSFPATLPLEEAVPARSDFLRSETAVSPRLLTPEETPSPHEHDIKHSSAYRHSSTSNFSESAAERSVNQHTQIRSSPPLAAQRYTNNSYLRNQQHLDVDQTQTPTIMFSSPTLPSQHMKEQRGSHMDYESSERPTLSPVARTGRVLQDIAVPSSPRSRSQSLGSPFKSPLTDRRSSSVAPPPEPISMQDRLTEPHPRLVLGSHFLESSQRLRRLSSGQEDPFNNDAEEKERSPSPEQDRLGMPQSRQQSEPRVTNRQLEVEDDGDAMSWQADEPSMLSQQARHTRTLPAVSSSRRYSLERDDAQGKRTAMTSEQRWEAEREEVRRQISSADPSSVFTIESDDEEQANNNEDEEDESFGLLLATLNSPVVQKQQPAKDIAEKSRRSKSPSSWRQKGKLAGEMSHMSSPPSPKTKHKTGGGSTSYSQPTAVHRVETQQSNIDSEADLSTWQIPQKSNFQPRVRETGHLDLRALLSASPHKDPPVLAKSPRPTFFKSKPKASESMSSTGSRGQAKPSSFSSQINRAIESKFAPIPQKMGFKPRPTSPAKQAPAPVPSQPKLFNLLSQSQQQKEHSPELPRLTKAFGGSSPSRTNTHLSQHHAPSSPVSSPHSIRSSQLSLSHEKENENAKQSSAYRTQDWATSLHKATVASAAPHPPSSPQKSCFRALPAPHTNNLSRSRESSPSKAVTFPSSSPLPSSPSPLLPPLSSTIWSQAHWELLDDILQDWKATTKAQEDVGTKRRNETRVVSRLLGRKVRSQGEEMVLQQWHLEVVDDFRCEVPGWEEKGVAMRVFSLVLACERRRRAAEKDT